MQLAVLSQRSAFRSWIAAYLARNVHPTPAIEHWTMLNGIALGPTKTPFDAVIIDGMYSASEIQAASNGIRSSQARARILLAFSGESNPSDGDPLFFQFGGCHLACVFPSEICSTTKPSCEQRAGCSQVARQHQTSVEERTLTSLQIEILKVLAEGASVKETAVRLNRTTKSIDCQKSRIMSKLGIHDRVQLARYAIRMGLVAP